MRGKKEDIVEGQRLLDDAHARPFVQSGIILACTRGAAKRRDQNEDMSMMRTLLLGLALAVPVAASAQTLYRWVDQDGNVRYSDVPPPAGVASRKLNVPAPTTPPGGAPPSLQQREEAFQKRMEEQKKADEKAAAAAKEVAAKEENCRRARAQLATLESGRRILSTDEKGEQSYMDEATRQREVGEASRAVQQWCGG